MNTQTPSRSSLQHRSTFWKSAVLFFVAFAVVSCQTASLYRADARRAASNGNYNKAVELSTQALAADSSSFEAWNDRGIWYTRLGDYSHALTDFTTAIALQPSRAMAYNNRIVVWLALQQPDSAIADCTTLLVMNPYNLNAQMKRARLYSETGKYQKAIQDYDVVLAFDPYYYWAYDGQSIPYRHLGQYTKAIENYNRAINTVIQLIQDIENTGENRYWYPQWGTNTPDHMRVAARQRAIESFEQSLSQLFANRALVYTDMDSLDRALEDYRTAFVWDSTNAYAYGNMGWTYYKKNDFSTCIRLSELAIRHNGMALFARFNRALAFLRLGDIQQATEAYRETIDFKEFLLHEGDYADSTAAHLSLELVPSFTEARQGAINDLRDLIQKGIQTEEAEAILRKFFYGEQDTP